MGLYSGGPIIGGTFVSEIGRLIFVRAYFLVGGGGLIIGILRYISLEREQKHKNGMHVYLMNNLENCVPVDLMTNIQ